MLERGPRHHEVERTIRAQGSGPSEDCTKRRPAGSAAATPCSTCEGEELFLVGSIEVVRDKLRRLRELVEAEGDDAVTRTDVSDLLAFEGEVVATARNSTI